MEMKWAFFIGACLLAWYFLLSAGAPPLTVAVGTAAAGFLTWRKSRHAH
jgi:hypothetical protein